MSKKKISVIIFCSIISILLVISYYFLSLDVIDNFFYKIIIHFKSDFMTKFLMLFTDLGSLIPTVILMAIMLIINRKKGLYFSLSIIIVILLNLILKNIFMRSRPLDINIITETGYGFPSGHAMNAIGTYGLLCYFLYNANIKKVWKNIGMTLSIVMMVIIPLSRVYLGVHYFTDITMGICLSTIWLMFYTDYLNKKVFKKTS